MKKRIQVKVVPVESHLGFKCEDCGNTAIIVKVNKNDHNLKGIPDSTLSVFLLNLEIGTPLCEIHKNNNMWHCIQKNYLKMSFNFKNLKILLTVAFRFNFILLLI